MYSFLQSIKTKKSEKMDVSSIFGLMGSILSSAINAASVAGTNTQNINNSWDLLNRQQEYSTQEAERSNQRMIENYNLLYSPAARVQQYKDAGLSTGLMYSSGSSTIGTSASQATTPSANIAQAQPINATAGMTDIMQAIKTITEAAKTKEDTKNAQKEGQKIEAETNKTLKEIEKIGTEINNNTVTNESIKLDNKLKELQLKFDGETIETRIETCKASFEQIKKTRELIEEQINGLKIENDKKSELLEATIKNLNEQTKLILKNQYLVVAQTAKTNAEKALAEAEKKLAEANKEKNEKEAEKAKAEKEKIESEKERIDIEIEAIENNGYYTTTAKGSAIDRAVGIMFDWAAKGEAETRGKSNSKTSYLYEQYYK